MGAMRGCEGAFCWLSQSDFWIGFGGVWVAVLGCVIAAFGGIMATSPSFRVGWAHGLGDIIAGALLFGVGSLVTLVGFGIFVTSWP